MDEKFIITPDEKESAVEEEKKKEKPPKFVKLFDEDQIEIKLLGTDDVENTVAVMKKCAFDVTKEEVFKVIFYGLSYGCYDNRMLVAVGLSWPTVYDSDKKTIVAGEKYNALYLEEPAVLLMYEGRGLRKILVEEREKLAKSRGLKYVLALLDKETPRVSIEDYIKESGSQLEKIYLELGYKFIPTQYGVLAVKKVG
ncbi:MAG: hypothetical protein QXZ30_00215 [Candidatus Bilamarchaeaceae archaeon]